MACMEENLKMMKARNWRESAANREEWCSIVKRLKPAHGCREEKKNWKTKKKHKNYFSLPTSLAVFCSK